MWQRKGGRFTESECLSGTTDDGSISDEQLVEKGKVMRNGMMEETLQHLSDHSSSNGEVREQPITTDSNTSSNDEHDSPPSTSDGHKDLIEDDAVIARIEKKLKEINQLELRQMNGYELKSEQLVKIKRKQSLLEKVHHLRDGGNNFVLNA